MSSAYTAESRIIQLFGLRRSGNHALLSWIISRLEGRILHLNEVTCARPYQCFARARAYGFSRYELYRRVLKVRGRGGINRYLPEHVLGRTIPFVSLKPDRLDPSVANRRKDALLLSYEDWELDHPKIPRILRPSERAREKGFLSFRVLLLRDPFNLFASLLQSGRMDDHNRRYYVRAWKQYAYEYLGDSDYLGGEVAVVNYNLWRDSAEYRAQLCQRLHLPVDDSAHASVATTGGGSSFDGLAADAALLQTDERWKHFATEQRYIDLFDEEVRELSRRAFGAPPL